MTNEELKTIEANINKALKSIQSGEYPPSTIINNESKFTEYVNSKIGRDILKECPTCELPLWNNVGATKHIQVCDETPILKKYRSQTRYCEECNIEIPKGKHYCEEHHEKWNRPSFTHRECIDCHIEKPKHHFKRRSYTCRICDTLKQDGNRTGALDDSIAKSLITYKQKKTYIKRVKDKSIPKHRSDIRELNKQIRNTQRECNYKIHGLNSQINQRNGYINSGLKGNKGRKECMDNLLIDAVNSLIRYIPPSDFSNKDNWTRTIIQTQETISKFYDIPITVIRNQRQEYCNIEKVWIKHIDDKVKEIQPNYTGTAPWILECLECGDEQEYPSRTALVRSLGLDGNGNKKYGGYCELCGQSQPQSDEMKRKARVSHIKNLGFDTWEEYEENIFVMGEYKNYGRIVRQLSMKNLRDYKPNEYKRLKANPWDSTINNYKTGLTIEHDPPVSECWRNRIPLKEAAHSDNLSVITMKENNESWQRYSNNIAQKNTGYSS
jgi:hypothetical protein